MCINKAILIVCCLILNLNYVILELETPAPDDSWTGIWFPHKPGVETETDNQLIMGVVDEVCDDGKTNLGNDFDPKNVTHSAFYLCCQPLDLFSPNRTVEPIITEYLVPAFYVANHKCLNETIEYDVRLPTFGTHRPLWPKFGEYLFLPPQRWLHALEHGAIVALYHPCTNKYMVEQLRKLVKNCLRRHVITPSDLVTPERPLALLAWGKSMEFSVTDNFLVEQFIKDNALKGPEKTAKDGQYEINLVDSASIVSTIEDDQLCAKYNDSATIYF